MTPLILTIALAFGVLAIWYLRSQTEQDEPHALESLDQSVDQSVDPSVEETDDGTDGQTDIQAPILPKPAEPQSAAPVDTDESEFVDRIRAAFARGDEDGAIQLFFDAAEAQPDNRRWPFDRGMILGDLGDHEGAIAGYRQAIEIDGTYLDAWVNLGRHLDESGVFDEALAAYDHALTLEGGSTDDILLSNRGNTLLSLGRLEEALQACDAALMIEPDSPALRGKQTALGYLGRADACNAARPLGSPHDRGPFFQLSRALPNGTPLVVRFWGARHDRPALLKEAAQSMLDLVASRFDIPPGLADGMRISVGFSALTLQERRGELVVCEPYFANLASERLCWDVGFTLQTIVMQGMVTTMVQPHTTESCSMLDIVAVDPDVFEQREAVLLRIPTEQDSFSGWMIGTAGSFPNGAPDVTRFRPMQALGLISARHALVKALHLPSGMRVRFEDHAIVSVLDEDGRERWA